MTAPAGAVVALHVDLVAQVVVGDVIETQTGRRYMVIACRQQQRGKHRGRHHLRAVVLAADDAEFLFKFDDAAIGPTLHKIQWYARSKSKR